MESAYAQALVRVVENGKSVKDAIASLSEALKRQGRTELLPKVVRALRRMAEREKASRPRVYVAHEKDGKAAFTASGLAEADVCIDETLIGGWRAESKESLMDMSFKKQLLSIYSSITA